MVPAKALAAALPASFGVKIGVKTGRFWLKRCCRCGKNLKLFRWGL
jgi:hypothetical protein